eukprot:SAG31_NODE_22734_length_519_cov_0.740476_2_plen_93_part_01
MHEGIQSMIGYSNASMTSARTALVHAKSPSVEAFNVFRNTKASKTFITKVLLRYIICAPTHSSDTLGGCRGQHYGIKLRWVVTGQLILVKVHL